MPSALNLNIHGSISARKHQRTEQQRVNQSIYDQSIMSLNVVNTMCFNDFCFYVQFVLFANPFGCLIQKINKLYICNVWTPVKSNIVIFECKITLVFYSGNSGMKSVG